MVKVDISNAKDFLPHLKTKRSKADRALQKILNEHGEAIQPDGWMAFQSNEDDIKEIEDVASKIRIKSQVLFVVGVGGSYLGAKAGLEFMYSANYNMLPKTCPDIIFVNNSMSETHLEDIELIAKNKSFSVLIISKSGSTFETSLAFKFMKKMLDDRYRNLANERLFVITGKGSDLHRYAIKNNLTTLFIPNNVGGRYSVLTPVGLLPFAVAGLNIRNILNGAEWEHTFGTDAAIDYALTRYDLYRNKYKVELFSSFEPNLSGLGQWWRQMFAESEGKKQKGLFPVCAEYSNDLHSVGQYVQDGERILIETMVGISNPDDRIPYIPDIHCEFNNEVNRISGMPLPFVKEIATKATIDAHRKGNVPVIRITVPALNEYYFGALIYFFALSCTISATLLGVDPFDQPAVEVYKTCIRERIESLF